MKDFIMWFYGVDAAQAAAREPVVWFALIVTIAALLTWGWDTSKEGQGILIPKVVLRSV